MCELSRNLSCVLSLHTHLTCLCMAELLLSCRTTLFAPEICPYFPSSPRETYCSLLLLLLLHLRKGAAGALLCWQMSRPSPREVDVCNRECYVARSWGRNPEWCSGHLEKRGLEGTLKGLDPPLLLRKSGSTLLVSYLTRVSASLFLNILGDRNFPDFPAVYFVASHSLPLKTFPEA